MMGCIRRCDKTSDMFEGAEAPELLARIMGQLDHCFSQVLSGNEEWPIDTFSSWATRVVCSTDAMDLSVAELIRLDEYEFYLRDRLIQITGEIPRIATGIYTTSDYLMTMEEH